MSIIDTYNKLRAEIATIDKALFETRNQVHGLSSEAIANIMLAHRHLEDARMRIGKVIQALEGGQSILDHPRVKAVIDEIRKENAGKN